MSKFGRKQRTPPDGFEVVEPTLTALENELREKVNEPHEGMRKTESQWPVHQINWQKSRYIYDMYYTFHRIPKEVYEYCLNNKMVDAALIAKWKKNGYERLCSTYAINPRNYKFGTVSICRVPRKNFPPGQEIEDPITGCRGCASGDRSNIFGNKYGQYLAAIQVAREEKQKRLLAKKLRESREEEDVDMDDAALGGGGGGGGGGVGGGAGSKRARHEEHVGKAEGGRDEQEEEDEDEGPVGAADGSKGADRASFWAKEGEDDDVELPDELVGQLSAEAEAEARKAQKQMGSSSSSSSSGGGGGGGGPPGKRSRV